MVKRCVIHTCNTIKAGDGVTLHRLPVDPTIRGLWFRAMLNKTGQTVFREEDEICSKHFSTESFNIVDGGTVLRLDAVPFSSCDAEEEASPLSPKRTKRESTKSSQCSVFSCSNSFKDTQLTRPNLIYYPFPKDKTSRASWKQFCNKTDDDFSQSFVCSDHFSSKDFQSDPSSSGNARALKLKAVPSIYKAEIKYEDIIEEGETGVTPQNPMELDYDSDDNSIPFVAEERICAIENCDSKSGGRSNIEYYPNVNSKSRKRRFSWTKSSEGLLLNCWKGHLNELRKAKRNSYVYVEMAKDLNALGIQASPEEIKTKVGNLTLRYRANRRVFGTTGGTPSDWPLYNEVHEVIGNLECNDPSQGDESIHGKYRSDLLGHDINRDSLNSIRSSSSNTTPSTPYETSASASHPNAPSTSTVICAPSTTLIRESGKKKSNTVSQDIAQLTEVLKSRMDALIEKSTLYDQLLIKEFKRFNDIIEKRFSKD